MHVLNYNIHLFTVVLELLWIHEHVAFEYNVTHFSLTCHSFWKKEAEVQYVPKWSARRGPDQTRTGLHTIKSVPLRRTSTGSCPKLDHTRVGFASTRLTVFNVHHCSQGLLSLSKSVVIPRVSHNLRSPSSLSKSAVILQVHHCYRSSSSHLLLLKPIISCAAEVRSCYWSTEPGQVGCIRTKSTSMHVWCRLKPIPCMSGLHPDHVWTGSGLACLSPLCSIPAHSDLDWTSSPVRALHFGAYCICTALHTQSHDILYSHTKLYT